MTLLTFTPLHSDGYGQQGYGRCMENFTSSPAAGSSPLSVQQLHMDNAAMTIDVANPNCSMSMKQQPFDYIGPSSCDAYSSLSMDQNVSYPQDLPPPPPPPAPPVQDYDADFGVLIGTDCESISADMPDVGPPPMRLPRLDPTMTVDTTVSNRDGSYPSFYGSHSSPHSPMSLGDTGPRKSHGITKASTRSRMKVPRTTILRASSPMFPDQSTPLSNLQRQASISSITSSQSIDQISNAAFSVSVKSDPGIYNHTCKSGVSSPSVSSQNGFDYSTIKSTSSQGSTGSLNSNSGKGFSMDDSTRSCLQLKMPAKYARRISDLDKKILRLQAERSKALEKAHHVATSLGPMPDDMMYADTDTWLCSEKMPDVGKVHLYIFPLGIHELDEGLYDDANKLLRQVGGMYLDLQTSISILRSICCKGMILPAEISTCFAYIKSLLSEKQNLKLSNVGGLYSIQLDVEEGLADGVQQVEFTDALAAANEVLRCAQLITSSYINVQMQLQRLRQVAGAKVDGCNSFCQKLGVMDRERRGQIHAVLEGNCTTMASAERVWPQYYQAATQTIKTITGCIHPSTAIM